MFNYILCPNLIIEIKRFKTHTMEHFYSEVQKRNRIQNSASNLNALSLLRTILSVFLVVLTTTVLFGQTTTYNYTGSVQTFTAPHTGKYLLEVWGAQGGSAGTSYPGGLGGYAKGECTLTAGQTISVYVGQQGRAPSGGTAWNGGGAGTCCGAGGGGGTDIRIGGTALSNRVIVAGAGGGGSNDIPSGPGGSGGGLSGVEGSSDLTYPPSYAGTQTTGYQLGVGESNLSDSGGGGGGYWGGGAGTGPSGGSGGGGSAYIGGVVSGSTSTGIWSGDGKAAVTVLCDPINVAGVPESYVCAGSSITLTATSENGGTLSWDNGITNGVAFVINSTTTYTVSSTSIDDCETSVTITVNDLDPVTPTLSDITAECSTTVTAPTTTDDCSGVITGTTSDPLTYNEQGTYTITWNFDDGEGNDIDVTQKVIINDVTNPTAVAHDTTLYLDAEGNASLSAIAIGSGSTDNCSIDTMYLSKYNFDCSDVGYIEEAAVIGEKSAQIDVPTEGQMVLLTVVDINDNHDYEWFRVIVEDTIPPVAVCKDTILELDSEGLVSLTAEAFGLGSDDACGIDGMTLSKTSFACVDLGVQKDTVTVTDVNGNSSVCIANVTVEDNVDPIVVAHDTTLFLDANGLAYLTPFSVDNGTDDNCGIDTMYLSQDTFDCSDIGIFAPVQVGLKSATGELPPFGVLVRLTAEDGSGNSSYDDFFVTVLDTISPTVETQNITVYLDENGAASIDSSDIDNGSFDNCTIETMSLDSTTFDCDEIGSNAVTLTVNDVNGNSAKKLAYVTVEDTISPSALSHDTTLYLDANGLAYLTAISVDNESYDNCSIDTMYLSQDTFNCSEVGTLQDTLTVIDGSGNTTISIFNVTIEDNIDPTVIAQDTVLYLNSDGIAFLTASVTGAESFDNCGIDTMYLSKDTFDCSYVGYIEPELMVAEKSATKKDDPEGVTVRLTAVDDNGNSNYTDFKVTVLDSIAPVVFCQDTFIYLDSKGVASIDTSFIFSNSGDACGVADIWLSKSNFNGSNVGPNTITVLASDVNGNVGSCTSTVTVMDTIAPVASCKDIGITLDTEGKARIYPGFIDDGSTDEGGIVSYTLDMTKFYCHDIGEHTVVMSVTDVGGNVSTCSSLVTIADNWLPEVACNDIEVTLGSEGFAVIDSSMIDAGSTAICGISGIELSQSVFTSADLGENSITMTVSNLSGITATCEAKVTVKDEIAPVANCNSITVWLTDSASYELTEADLVAISSGSSDNASAYDSLQIEVTPSTFDCSQVGDSVKLAVSVFDEAGNESTCEAMVYVKDSSELLLSSVDDIEISLPAGVCETAITYPEVFSSKACATITQIAGLGADGLFPAGTTVESWEVSYGEEKDTVSFAVIVNAENAVPTLDSLADVSVNEDEGPVVIALSGISAGVDCVEQTLSITAENSNSELVTGIEVVYTEGDTTGSISLTLGANQSGTDSISVVVEDSEGAQTEVSFVLTVNPVNDVPYLVTPLPDGMVNASYSFVLELSAMMGVVFDDVDDDVLEFDVMLEGTESLPSWAAIEAGVLTATPMIADTGSYSFVVTATDTSGAMARDTFVLEVDGYPTSIGDIAAGSFELNLYPNPTKGLVTVELQERSATDIEIKVMNLSGAEVFRKNFGANDKIQINLSDQVSGMYMVLIESDGQRVVKKLILDKR